MRIVNNDYLSIRTSCRVEVGGGGCGRQGDGVEIVNNGNLSIRTRGRAGNGRGWKRGLYLVGTVGN